MEERGDSNPRDLFGPNGLPHRCDTTVMKSRAIAHLNRKGNLSNSKASLGLVAEEEGFETLSSLTALRRVIALRRAPEPLISIDHIRQALDGLGTQFSALG
jgi:hypothetical protein